MTPEIVKRQKGRRNRGYHVETQRGRSFRAGVVQLEPVEKPGPLRQEHGFQNVTYIVLYLEYEVKRDHSLAQLGSPFAIFARLCIVQRDVHDEIIKVPERSG